MTSNCDNCPLFNQCNNVYDRVARQAADSRQLSEQYDTPEVRGYIESIEQRMNLRLDDIGSRDAENLKRLQRIERSVKEFEDSRVERAAVLDEIADTMMQVIGSVAVCDGPNYGRIASWAIDKMEQSGDYQGASYFRAAYARCANPDLPSIHQRLRQVSSHIPGISK